MKVGEEFEIERDGNGWQLHQWKTGISRKTKEPTRTKHTTYYSRLEHVCEMIIDRRAGMAEHLNEVVDAIDRAREELKQVISESA